jgi:hypothetical protein
MIPYRQRGPVSPRAPSTTGGSGLGYGHLPRLDATPRWPAQHLPSFSSQMAQAGLRSAEGLTRNSPVGPRIATSPRKRGKVTAARGQYFHRLSVLIGLPLPGKAEICKGAGNRNSQPTRPEWNAQPADLHLPSKDDPQEMDYPHREKQRRGDGHISFSVQSACPSTSHAQHDDSSTTASCSMPRSLLLVDWHKPVGQRLHEAHDRIFLRVRQA